MSGGGGGSPGDDRNSMAILWIIGGTFFLGTVIWWSFAPQLKFFFIKVRLIQLTILYWVLKFLPLQSAFIDVTNALELTRTMTPGNINLTAAEYVSTVVGEIYRWPILIFLVFFAYVMYVKNIKMRYKKHYNMQQLAQQERTEWPQINPVLDLDLVAADIDSGPWAMSTPPVAFCRQHGLLEVAIAPPAAGTINKAPKFKATLNKAKTEHIFAQQLGRMWRGPEQLPLHRKALFAAFIARGMRDTQKAQNLIRQINFSATGDASKELDFTGADELLAKHYESKQVQDIVGAHAYELTLFMAIFLFARQDGVFPTSDFLWLKPRDRSFWYVLNSVGRQTPCCESAAVQAHFLAEKALGRALSVPMIGEATKALELALNDIIYIPGEEEKEQLLKAANEAEL